MSGLYSCVLKGVYEPIPPCFSRELSQVIRSMLHVTASRRPSCEDLLSLPMLAKRAHHTANNSFHTALLAEISSTDPAALPRPNYNARHRSELPSLKGSPTKLSSVASNSSFHAPKRPAEAPAVRQIGRLSPPKGSKRGLLKHHSQAKGLYYDRLQRLRLAYLGKSFKMY
jgi:hypothetical protein